jgi:hypothetical protein
MVGIVCLKYLLWKIYAGWVHPVASQVSRGDPAFDIPMTPSQDAYYLIYLLLHIPETALYCLGAYLVFQHDFPGQNILEVPLLGPFFAIIPVTVIQVYFVASIATLFTRWKTRRTRWIA